jgi:hypothetical protein
MLQTGEKALEKGLKPGGLYFMGIQVRAVAVSFLDHARNSQ